MMYSWKSLRLVATLLLCLPLLHATYLASSELAAYLNTSPKVWDDELAAIVARDQQGSLPDRAVLVVGGHGVRLWDALPAALKPRQTLLRPLGDPTVEDITHHYDRLIGYYRPDILVILPSYADLHLRDHKLPGELSTALKSLLKRDADYGITARRYVMVPLKTLLHPGDDARIDAMSQRMGRLETSLDAVTVLDANPLLAGADGRPNPDFYRGDGIHLNALGYARMTLFLRNRLEADGVLNASG